MQTTSNAIWKQFNEALHSFICHKVDHGDHCNDILQELYLKIYINIGKIEQARNIRAYVFRMAHNTITDYHRKQQRGPEYANDDLIKALALTDQPETHNEYQLADCCLRPMINALPEIYRDALIYTELEGFTQQQLANKMGLSLPAAKSRVQRAREKLKAAIIQCCNYEFDKYGNILSCCESPASCKIDC